MLRSDVRQLLAAQTAHEIAIERATATLCAEIAAENVFAFGRLGIWHNRHFRSTIHELIPPVFFANPDNTIIADGWATCGWDKRVQDWADWNGPDWGDVKFKRDDVLRLIQRLFRPTTMQIDSGYISRLFATDDQLRTAELTDPLVLIYEEEISRADQLFPLTDRILISGESLMIIAGDVEGEALEFLVMNRQRGGLPVVAVQAPGSGDSRRRILDKIADFTGGLVVNKRLGIHLRDFRTVTDRMLGRAKRVLIERDKTTIFGGAGADTRAETATAAARTSEAFHIGQSEIDADAILSDRTGAQGRPTSRHLVQAEFERRIAAGTVLESLKGEAQALSDWLRRNHLGFAQMSRKTVETCIRESYRVWKAAK